MFSLSQPTIEVLNKYYNLFIKKIETARKKSPKEVSDYFTIERIKRILLDKPEDLYTHHNEFFAHFFHGRTDFDSYLIARAKRKNREAKDDLLIEVYDKTIEDVTSIFNYESFISQNKDISYKFAKILDRNTCTYCNRQYTLTVSEGNSHIIRPQFDHWFAKSSHPILALSFYNLIPSCSICNSSIKGSDVFTIKSHVHPYIQNYIQDNYTFSYKKKNIFEDNITITTTDSKIENCITAFKLREVYNAHSAYELKDLLELRYKYPKDYIRTLLYDTFDKLHMSESEAYRIVFGTEYDSKDFHKRPFSKFKKDIIDELLNT